MSQTGPDALAVVVVTHNSAEHLRALAHALEPQLRDGDELVLVDNASSDGTAELARALGGDVRVIETGANLGFAGGCHAGAAASTAPLLLFLNPDSEPEPNCLDLLRAASPEQPGWGAWQAAVMLSEDLINTSGGVVHYLGIGWAGDCGRQVSALPAANTEVAFPSGAAMVVRRGVWEQLGGFDRDYFMYGEDLDLGLRVWLAGHRVGIIPAARVLHRYEFDKGHAKWFWLERNRWRTVLSVYPGALLALVLPALLAAEIGLLAVAARDGWLVPKLRAQRAGVAQLPGTLGRRRRVQRTRRIGAGEFARHLTSSLDSSYLGGIGRSPLGVLQTGYWRAVQRLLPLLGS